ncbi:MAG: hypothetical protein ABIR92_10190 [Gemmatimonadaceae bacterium]
MAFLASMAVGGALAGCGEATGPTSPIGAYSLTTVAAKALPVVMYEAEGYSLSVTAGEIALKADSTYTASMSVLETVDGNKSNYVDRETGTWVEGAAGEITLRPTGAQAYGAVWSGNTLTVAQVDLSLVYARQ